MNWTLEEIERNWLAGSQIAVDPSDIVAAFNRCERLLGRDWIESAQRGNSAVASDIVTGSMPTLRVVSMGHRLASIDGVAESQPLIRRIQNGDASAVSELSAIFLLRSDDSRVELEPLVRLGNVGRKCDFRIQHGTESWTYVEVTRPDTSDAQARAEGVLQSVCDRIVSVNKPFSLELFFRREPSDEEVEIVIETALQFCSANHQSDAVIRGEMPNGMGLLILNQHPAGRVVLNDHGEENVPRLGMSRFILGPGQPNRLVAVRMPYADQRAERFLTSEARQLPIDAPGLVMVDVTQAPGGFRSWEPIIRRRFQPAMHTRVGGVCLFFGGFFGTAGGEASLFQTRLITNDHARIPLPTWIGMRIEAAAGKFEAATKPSPS